MELEQPCDRRLQNIASWSFTLFTRYYLADNIYEDEISREWVMYVSKQKCIYWISAGKF